MPMPVSLVRHQMIACRPLSALTLSSLSAGPVGWVSSCSHLRMVEADVGEVMIALPGQLFFNTQIPACLWFLNRQKPARPGEVLFIDARKLGCMISRVQAELTDEVIERIGGTVAAWRDEADADAYQDIPGYCRSVSLAEIGEHGHVLTPGRYVGAEEVEDDDEAFAEKMQKLTEKLGEQMAKGAKLDALIRQKLGGLGYEF